MRFQHWRWLSFDFLIPLGPCVFIGEAGFEEVSIEKAWYSSQIASKLRMLGQHAIRLDVDASRISRFEYTTEDTGMNSTSLNISRYLVECVELAASLH